MSGEKRFGSSMMGYNKSDVDTYVEIVISQCNQRLEKKDKEIAELKSQLSNVSETIVQEKDTEIEQLKLKLSQMQDADTSKNIEIEQIKQQMYSVEAAKTAEFEREIEQLRLQVAMFENEKNKPANNSELEQIKIEVEALIAEKDEEIDSLKAQIEGINVHTEIPQTQVDDLNAKILELINERSTITETISEKEAEIEQLHSQLASASGNKFDVEEMEKRIMAEKDKVANALIFASEKADNIIAQAEKLAQDQVEQAMLKSTQERKALEELVDLEREKLVDVKREILEMKSSLVSILKKYEREIDQAAGEM